MHQHFLWLLVATVAAQVPTLLSMKHAAANQLSVYDAGKIALLTLPMSIFATIAYLMYYGNGSQSIAYPVLSIGSTSVALLFAVAIQTCIFKTREMTTIEMVGLAICAMGFVIAVCGRSVN